MLNTEDENLDIIFKRSKGKHKLNESIAEPSESVYMRLESFREEINKTLSVAFNIQDNDKSYQEVLHSDDSNVDQADFGGNLLDVSTYISDNVLPFLEQGTIIPVKSRSHETLMEELMRIRNQISELQEEYTKEAKFKEASMALVSLYGSKEPISYQSNVKKLKKKNASVSSKGELPNDSLLPALVRSSQAFVDASVSSLALSDSIRELHKRESEIISQLAYLSLKDIVKENAVLKQRINLMRAQSHTETISPNIEPVNNVVSSPSKDHIVQILCEEIVRLRHE